MLSIPNQRFFGGTTYTYKDNDTSTVYGPYKGREAVLTAFLTRCVKESIGDETIFGVCFHDAFKGSAIHTHCHEQGDPRGYLEQQLALVKANTTAAAAAPTASRQSREPLASKCNGHTVARAKSSIALPVFEANETTTVDLADLISSVSVPRNRKICCPFHSETKPSLHVYPDHYYCFGCQAYGDHIDWLTRVEGLSLTAAAEKLSNWDGPVIPQSRLTGEPTNDANGAGQKAAAECKRRWQAAGRSGAVLMPPHPGSDFNDVVLERLAGARAGEAVMGSEP